MMHARPLDQITYEAMRPLDNQLTGDVHAFFADYDSAANRAMIFAVFDKLKSLQGDPDLSVKEAAARYPDTTKPR
jgi:hypothetical protein